MFTISIDVDIEKITRALTFLIWTIYQIKNPYIKQKTRIHHAKDSIRVFLKEFRGTTAFPVVNSCL